MIAVNISPVRMHWTGKHCKHNTESHGFFSSEVSLLLIKGIYLFIDYLKVGFNSEDKLYDVRLRP